MNKKGIVLLLYSMRHNKLDNRIQKKMWSYTWILLWLERAGRTWRRVLTLRMRIWYLLSTTEHFE